MEDNNNLKIFQCPICPDKYNNIISLCRHWTRTHKLKTKELYLKLHNLEQEPTCACGCGERVKFLDAGRGFSEYIRGHISRVSNNYQKNPETFQKSLDSRRKMIEDGTWKPFCLNSTGEPWAKGLTKETDERIAKMAASCSSPKNNKKRSELMRKNRLNGVIRTLYGPEHPKWAGGISTLYAICHANKNLYNNWKFPLLKKYNFSCGECGNNSYNIILEVHHDKETFSEIVRKIAEQLKWPLLINESTFIENDKDPIYKLKLEISDAVAQYHIDNNVSGIVLCQECHKKLHQSHNF